MQPNFFLLFILSLWVSDTYQELPEMKQVPPRSFPYIADIESHEWCQGILITDNYILTNARCVYGSQNIQIYLGWYSYPEDKKPVNESDIQIYSSSAVIAHPDYQVIKKYWMYLNDVALVKLSQAVSVTSGVKPARLANPKVFNEKDLTGTIGTVFGWWPAKYLSAAGVQIQSHEDCRDIFGRNYLKDRNICARWPLGDRLCSHHSLPLEINGYIIGLQMDDPQNDIECGQFEYKFLNLLFYYNWIVENSDLEEYVQKVEKTSNKSGDVSDGKQNNTVAIINDFNGDEQKLLDRQAENLKSAIEKTISAFPTSTTWDENNHGDSMASEGLKESLISDKNHHGAPKRRCKIDIELACPRNKES